MITTIKEIYKEVRKSKIQEAVSNIRNANTEETFKHREELLQLATYICETFMEDINTSVDESFHEIGKKQGNPIPAKKRKLYAIKRCAKIRRLQKENPNWVQKLNIT